MTDEEPFEGTISAADRAHLEAARWEPAHARVLRRRILLGRTPVDPRTRIPLPRRSE